MKLSSQRTKIDGITNKAPATMPPRALWKQPSNIDRKLHRFRTGKQHAVYAG